MLGGSVRSSAGFGASGGRGLGSVLSSFFSSGALSMYGRALREEQASYGSRWNSQWMYTLPSGETIASGGLPKGPARRA